MIDSMTEDGGRNSLRRVTGGEYGLGAQIRSLMNEEAYTPMPKTSTKLEYVQLES